jgi:hypothetical protein
MFLVAHFMNIIHRLVQTGNVNKGKPSGKLPELEEAAAE